MAKEDRSSANGDNGASRRLRRVAGCDLGKATAKFVVGTIDADGQIDFEAMETVAHQGQPMAAFRDWYARAEVAAACEALGATGLHADELVAPVVAGLPEDTCLEAALPFVPGLQGPLNLVSIGARGYAVLTRGSDGHVQYLENDKCSSGTGETMVKIAGRFGLSIEQADSLARSATDSIPITARCSVFAKSEMTHFGNQGRPADELFRGYFASVADYIAALLARARVEGPIVAVGGGTRIGALVEALRRTAGEQVLLPDHPLHFEAIGAMLLVAEQCNAEMLAPLPADPAGLIRPRKRRFRALAPASEAADRVQCLEAAAPVAGAELAPSILGLDLGSTGAKAVLASLATGELVLDAYDRTRGNPVDAARRLIEAILEQVEPDIRALGITGSGREAVATVMRAAYPDLADRIVVVNEIVAHATAAIRCDPEDGRSLSVVEIGGQDAKFIQILGGQIVESDMNKACSAGTGSFLEEQAVFYGIHDIAEFTRQAQHASRPPDLGQMCTVFVADAAADAHNEGFAREDIFGGFQYSVIHNYINRVMGQRTFGERIFFQGKPATGPALAWTLAAVTDREVMVPPNPGAMGAWGIALCAREALGTAELADAPAFDLATALGATVVGRSELQCRDKQCATLCAIEKTQVEVGGTSQTVYSGGACPKFEISTAARPKLPKEAPSAFDEREALLAPWLEEQDAPGRTVGVPLVGACYAYLPWLVTLLRGLGLRTRVLRSDRRSLSRGEARCYSFDACAPVKIAHGVLDADIDTIFFPKLLTLGDRDGSSGRTCPMEQALPELIRESLGARGLSSVEIVHPLLHLDGDLHSEDLIEELAVAAAQLGADRERLAVALRLAANAQHQYEAELSGIGERTLEHGRAQGIPVVVMCGAQHVIHDRAVNAGIPKLLRENGVLALPMDCFPIPADTHSMPRIVWADTHRTLRTAVAARAQGNIFPLLLSSFGCGPSSFAEQTFSALMEGYPHTSLESDGHGGAAGYVTRVQAFLHAVRQYDGGPSPTPRKRLRLLEPLRHPPITQEKDSRLVIFTVGDRIASLVATAYRSLGFDAVPASPCSAEVLSLGRRDCSGKECLPYQLLWGSFRKHIEESESDKRTLLMQVTGQGMCRNCMFSIKDQVSLERLGLQQDVAVRHFEPDPELGWRLMLKIWEGIVGWDLLYQLAGYHRPLEGKSGEVDELYERFCDELDSIIARPIRAGMRGLVDAARENRTVFDLVERASQAFAGIRRRARNGASLRTVLLSGDIYVRLDEFASDRLTRRLNERGLRVIVEPTSTFPEYTAHEHLKEIFGLPTEGVDNAVIRVGMRLFRREAYSRVRTLHPWLPMTDIPEILDESLPILDRYPHGEAPITIGSVLHHWRLGVCDGVVVVSPWGCGPALVSESMLRHRRNIPMLFVYCDGSPIDERRLSGFAFRLRRSPPQSRLAQGATAYDPGSSATAPKPLAPPAR